MQVVSVKKNIGSTLTTSGAVTTNAAMITTTPGFTRSKTIFFTLMLLLTQRPFRFEKGLWNCCASDSDFSLIHFHSIVTFVFIILGSIFSVVLLVLCCCCCCPCCLLAQRRTKKKGTVLQYNNVPVQQQQQQQQGQVFVAGVQQQQQQPGVGFQQQQQYASYQSESKSITSLCYFLN